MLGDFIVFVRDVTQAYVQSQTVIQRPIFINPPPMLRIPQKYLLQVHRPLYGLPEAGLHWFKTYHDHFKNNLRTDSTCHVPCLLYTKDITHDEAPTNFSKGITCLQTDDTLNAGNKTFIDEEHRLSNKFECKAAKFLSASSPVKFNGAIITCGETATKIRKIERINNLKEITVETANQSTFISERARGACIASTCQPDLTYGFSVCSQLTDIDKAAASRLNKYISTAISTPTKGLKFVKLESSSLRIAVFADTSFACNPDLSSRLGFVVTLMDAHNSANIFHYSSFKSKRVTRSVLAAELFAVVHAFDYASTVRLAFNEIMGKDFSLVIYTD